MFNKSYNPDVLTCLANLSSDEVFTPPHIVNQMLDLLPQELFRDKNTTFLDPVCKSGVFLREIAKRLMEGLKDEIPNDEERRNHIFKSQLYGIGITELTALLSRRSIYCSKTANGEYSVVEFDDEQGNIKYERNEHTWVGGKCSYCGANKEKYERETELESYTYEFIHTDNPETLFNMKFDVIVGNPPYQLNVGQEKENYAVLIYDKFVEQAKKLNPTYLTMVIPSRWFTGGRGMNSFREEMLNDRRIKAIVDYTDSRECFPGVDVAGGVLYFLWDRNYDGDCNFTNVTNGKRYSAIRKLNKYSIFPRYVQGLSIIEKVLSKGEPTLSESVSRQTPFGFHTTYLGRQGKIENSVNVLASSGVYNCDYNDITVNKDLVNKYKVIFSKATSEHAGQVNKSGLRKIFSSLQIIEPNTVCTQTYLVGGAFETRIEAQGLISYLSTRFARFLLFQALTSQDISREKFCFVPSQDYSASWTDEKLYKKYGLNQEEIDFIESMIRPMEEEYE